MSATHKGGPLDHASRIGSLFLQSMPSFGLGFMLILLFAVVVGGWRHDVLDPRMERGM